MMKIIETTTYMIGSNPKGPVFVTTFFGSASPSLSN